MENRLRVLGSVVGQKGVTAAASLVLLIVLPALRGASAYEVVLSAQGEYVDGYLVNGKPFPPRVIVDDPDPHPPDSLTQPPFIGGRHLNGQVCFFPPRAHRPHQYVVADDTYRESCLDTNAPQARCAATDPLSPFFIGTDPDGWAILDRKGRWTGEHIHTPWDFSQPTPQGNMDPQGCAFDRSGRLFATDVGSEQTGLNDGSLMVFFPGKDRSYEGFCFLDKALADPGMPAIDRKGRLYVPEPQAGRVTRFSRPFPRSPADCDNPEHLVTTPPTKTTWLQGGGGLTIPVSIVRVPHSRHFYVAGAILPPIINEYNRHGTFVRNIVPAGVPKNPLGMAVGRDGTLYYAELNLDPATLDTRCGSLSMVRFDNRGNPLPPETLGQHLLFPDGVTVIDSSQLRIDFKELQPSPDRDPSECGGE
jgi:hypothetical protein